MLALFIIVHQLVSVILKCSKLLQILFLAPLIEEVTVTVATNFTATLNISRALFPLLQPHARVVNMSSVSGLLQKYNNPDIRVRTALIVAHFNNSPLLVIMG